MTKRTSSRKRRRTLWIAASLGLLVAAMAKIFGFPSNPLIKTQDVTAGYQIKDDQVIWYSHDRSTRIFASLVTLGGATNSTLVKGIVLERADVSSFRKLGDQHGRDRLHVWYRGELIEGVDLETFAVLERGFSRDEKNIWQGATLVLSLDSATDLPIAVHSERILSVGADTWLTGTTPPLLLPETPRSAPKHHCRDWFFMNKALWWGQHRVLDIDGPAEVVDCDGSVRTTYENGHPYEDLQFNQGILLRDGAKIWHVRMDREPMLLAILPASIVETRLFRVRSNEDRVLLARTSTGTTYAMAVTPQPLVQTLGRFSALPDPNALTGGQAFWLEGRFFTLITARDPGDPVITDHGPAERIGDMALVSGSLYYGATIIAHPGNLPLRQIAPGNILIGPSCFHFGSFSTDVPDPEAPPEALLHLCDRMRKRTEILYDGVRIGFLPNLVDLGPLTDRPHLNHFQLGEVFLENAGNEATELPASFLEGFELRVQNKIIEPLTNAWPEEGLRLAPGQRHTWQLYAHSDQDPRTWGWVLNMRHSVERASLFGEKRFNVGHGGFSYSEPL